MLKATGRVRTVCLEGDNCKRRLKNGDQNHQDEENGDLDSTEERKKIICLELITRKDCPLGHTHFQSL